jgi:hemolysin III
LATIQSKQEELWNVLTHGLGAVIYLAGFVFLLFNFNSELVSPIYVVIYGLSLILLFSASTIYHYATNPSYKRHLRKLDHISIYVLIAGTYTPICMSVLAESRGLYIFIAVWSIALIGLILKLFFTGKFEKISLLLYLVMGWLVVIDFETLTQSISTEALLYLILGGVFYTGGVVFYVMHKLKYHHVIWHVFVLLGSLFHFLMVYEIIKL